MSGVAPIKGGRKKSQRTWVQPCTDPSWTKNILENEQRGETTDTLKKGKNKELRNIKEYTKRIENSEKRRLSSWAEKKKMFNQKCETD